MTDGASRQTTYQYDALDRLTQADHPAMPAPLDSLPDVENFTYDGVGNRTMTGYAHDANHRMRESPGHTYDYDEDGNLVMRDPNTPGQVSHGWNLDSRMATFSATSTSASYFYDLGARRLKKTVGSTTTWFLWAGERMLAEYGGSGAREIRHVYTDGWSSEGLAIGAALSTETRRVVGADRLDTPLLGVGSSGVPHWRGAYEAYGRAHVDQDPDDDFAGDVLNTRLPGQYSDAESGLHYNRFRYYAPELGAYIGPDPIGQLGDTNVYRYAKGAPTSAIDAYGLVVSGVFDRDTGTVTIQDLDTGQTVSAKAFSGTPGVYQAAPSGTYTISDFPWGRSAQDHYFALLLNDGRLDDYADGYASNYDPTKTMSGIRFHAGYASHACVTVPSADDKDPWLAIQRLLDNTKKGPPITIGGEKFPNYGTLRVIGSGFGAVPTGP